MFGWTDPLPSRPPLPSAPTAYRERVLPMLKCLCAGLATEDIMAALQVGVRDAALALPFAASVITHHDQRRGQCAQSLHRCLGLRGRACECICQELLMSLSELMFFLVTV